MQIDYEPDGQYNLPTPKTFRSCLKQMWTRSVWGLGRRKITYLRLIDRAISCEKPRRGPRIKFIGFSLIAAAIASLGGCALYENAKKAQVEGVGTAQSAAIDYEFRAGGQMTIKHANSAPQKFASTATATDKVFAVMDMPSLEAAPPGSFDGQLNQSTREETVRYMSTDTASHVSTGKDLEAIGLNAIGGNVGCAGMALSLIGDSPKVAPPRYRWVRDLLHPCC